MIPTTATTTPTATTITARRTRLVAGAAALVAAGTLLGACGLPGNGFQVIAERADRTEDRADRTEDRTEDPTDTTDTTAPDTTATDSSLPPIWLPVPDDTVVPGDTVPAIPATDATVPVAEPVAVPAGAVEVGHGVVVVPSPGWTVTVESGVLAMTDGTVSVQAQVLRRTAGEDPSVPMQEYVDTFDATSGTITYQPARFTWSTTEPVSIDRYSLWYSTFDDSVATGRGVDGGIHLSRRDDGLTLVYDVWAAAGVVGDLPTEMYDSLWNSFVAAPSIGAPVVLSPAPTFRVSSVSTPVIVDGIAGLTPAPGFGVVSNEAGSAIVSNGSDFDVEVHTFTAVADTVDALGRAQQIVTDTFGPVTFADELTYDADAFGVQRRSIGWNGSCGGSSCGGTIDVFVDPTTAKSYAVMAEWLWNPADGSAPHQPAWNFMWTSMTDSFDQIV